MVDTINQEEVRVIYRVLHDKPITKEEMSLSKATSASWSSLMSKVFSNKYTEIIYKLSELKSVIPDRIRYNKRFTVEELNPILSEGNVIGTVDLISSSFLFDRSPLDLQLYILTGLGVTPGYLAKFNK